MINHFKTGSRVWDFNEDGLANYGLLPDMLADLETIGVPARDLEPLFNSASSYVQVGERASAQIARQLVWDGVRWTDQHLSGAAGTIALADANSPLTSFVKRNGSEHVIYIGTDQHVRQLVWDGARWADQDLTGAAGNAGLPASSGALAGFSKIDDTEHVYYVATDGRVRQLYWDNTRWYDQDLTTASGGQVLASAGSPLTSFFKADGSEHVYYIGADQHVHQLVSGGPRWIDQDLTRPTSDSASPTLRSSLTAFVKADGSEHLFYLSSTQ